MPKGLAYTDAVSIGSKPIGKPLTVWIASLVDGVFAGFRANSGDHRMSVEVLEAYVRKYIASQPDIFTSDGSFAFQQERVARSTKLEFRAQEQSQKTY